MLATAVLLPSQAEARRTTLRIVYSSRFTPACKTCNGDPDDLSRACSSGPLGSGWSGGARSFADPVPAGSVVTAVTVTYHGGCAQGDVSAELNGTLVETRTVDQSCSCGSCPRDESFTSITYTCGWPGYNYGGSNTVRLSPGGGVQMCVDWVEVTLEYGTPDPSCVCDGCEIGATCYPDGTFNPADACQVCDSTRSSTGWSDAPAGTPCDDGAFCTVDDACNNRGACVGLARDCADADTCTMDACDEATDMCTHMLGSSCSISGVCYADGAPNPANPCERCDVSMSTTAWSPAPVGSACSDGSFCTINDACDASGACVGSMRACSDGNNCTTDMCDEAADQCVSTGSFCDIAGACHADGTVNPANECEVCDVARTPIGWSPQAAGTSCDDGQFCTVGDACDNMGRCGGAARSCDDMNTCTMDTCNEVMGRCDNVMGASCSIDGACYADGALNPANPCERCDVATATDAWSVTPAGEPCDDGAACTVLDECDGAGACAGTDLICDDTLDCTGNACDEAIGGCVHLLEQGCLIDGACFADGVLDPQDPCQVCDSAEAFDGWSDVTGPCEAPDAGVPDAGGVLDAGASDAGAADASAPDAGAVDAGLPRPAAVRGSCLCLAPGEGGGRGSGGFGLVLVLAGLLMFRRRRKKGRPR